jgi:ribonuclease P protein component
LLPRLKTSEQFAAVLDASKLKGDKQATDSVAAGSTGIWRSTHFALHMVSYEALSQVIASPSASAPPDANKATIGVICPKRWSKRAVTRNTIKRQIYAVSSELAPQLPPAFLVVRQSASFARDQFASATSAALKRALRQELLGLLGKLSRAAQPSGAV